MESNLVLLEFHKTIFQIYVILSLFNKIEEELKLK